MLGVSNIALDEVCSPSVFPRSTVLLTMEKKGRREHVRKYFPALFVSSVHDVENAFAPDVLLLKRWCREISRRRVYDFGFGPYRSTVRTWEGGAGKWVKQDRINRY